MKKLISELLKVAERIKDTVRGKIVANTKQVAVEQINELVDSLEYRYHQFEGTTLTVCTASLPNGFSVAVGQSACIDPDNFNAETGQRIARENARKQAIENLWQFEGYRLTMEG